MSQRFRLDRHELAGAFGDIGTDLPLLVGMIAVAHLDAASVFTLYGVAQIATGLYYGIPMAVQPLKAMAAIMIARQLPAGTLVGGGLTVGAVMMFLARSGLLTKIARLVPHAVVRGIQAGLAITLGWLAVSKYALADGRRGVALAVGALVVYLVARRQRRVPAPLLVIGLGLGYALVVGAPLAHAAAAFGVHLPIPRVPTVGDIGRGAYLLALPQLALSLGNSVIATSKATHDLFPERALGVRRIGVTYGIMNLYGPLCGGVPTCHGCGGLVGFYNFGARTGGAPFIYGSIYLVLGFLFAPAANELVRLFPMPILGVVLLLESLALLRLTRDAAPDRRDLLVAVVVVGCVLVAPGGFATALCAGTALAWVLGVGRKQGAS